MIQSELDQCKEILSKWEGESIWKQLKDNIARANVKFAYRAVLPIKKERKRRDYVTRNIDQL